MNIEDFKMAFIGGLIIGAASALLLLLNGRIAGISGIMGRLLNFQPSDRAWRFAFLFGMIVSGYFLKSYFPESFMLPASTPVWQLALAGILVGFGSREGSGCTSGHGVCGISRFSMRSIIATAAFMGAGIVTVFVLRLIGVHA